MQEVSTFSEHTASNAASAATGLALAQVIGVGFVRSSGTTHKVAAPHCAAHEGGVSLDTRAGELVVAFRSLPAFRAFCAENGTPPVPP
jgi:hypothetical protein